MESNNIISVLSEDLSIAKSEDSHSFPVWIVVITWTIQRIEALIKCYYMDHPQTNYKSRITLGFKLFKRNTCLNTGKSLK